MAHHTGTFLEQEASKRPQLTRSQRGLPNPSSRLDKQVLCCAKDPFGPGRRNCTQSTPAAFIPSTEQSTEQPELCEAPRYPVLLLCTKNSERSPAPGHGDKTQLRRPPVLQILLFLQASPCCCPLSTRFIQNRHSQQKDNDAQQGKAMQGRHLPPGRGPKLQMINRC